MEYRIDVDCGMWNVYSSSSGFDKAGKTLSGTGGKDGSLRVAPLPLPACCFAEVLHGSHTPKKCFWHSTKDLDDPARAFFHEKEFCCQMVPRNKEVMLCRLL